LNWKEKGIRLKQETNFPFEEKTRLTITEGSGQFELKVRYPGWVAEGAFQVKINGEVWPVSASPSSYVGIDRLWQKGDVVEIRISDATQAGTTAQCAQLLCFYARTHFACSQSRYHDLAGLVADDSRWGHIAHGERLPVDEAPVIVADDITEITENLKPVLKNAFTFKLSDLKMVNAEEILLEPSFQIHDARYSMYWMVLSETGYQAHLDSIAND
jgi:uncharacterized protein